MPPGDWRGVWTHLVTAEFQRLFHSRESLLRRDIGNKMTIILHQREY